MRKIILLVSMLFSVNVFALNVTMSATSDGSDTPTIIGATNLPDGIELMATIGREASSYFAQGKGIVKKGKFSMGPFSQGETGLNPGQYVIEISMAVAGLQPPNTWPIIGNDGANLTGPLVIKSVIGGHVVEYKSTFKIGNDISASKDKESRKSAAIDKHEWWLNTCTTTCAIAQNLARNNDEKFEWDRCYYKCVADEHTN